MFSVEQMAIPRRTAPSTECRVLVIDHYDSFTYNLVHLLASAGARSDVIAHDRVEPATVTQYDGVLLGPGHGRPEETKHLLAQLLAHTKATRVLGVCLGHQAVALLFGAHVKLAAAPTHGKRVAIYHQSQSVLRNLSAPFWAARYNSLCVDPQSLPPCLEVIAREEHGEIMAVRHRTLPIVGIQFHPESILSEGGIVIIRNWLEDL